MWNLVGLLATNGTIKLVQNVYEILKFWEEGGTDLPSDSVLCSSVPKRLITEKSPKSACF